LGQTWVHLPFLGRSHLILSPLFQSGPNIPKLFSLGLINSFSLLGLFPTPGGVFSNTGGITLFINLKMGLRPVWTGHFHRGKIRGITRGGAHPFVAPTFGGNPGGPTPVKTSFGNPLGISSLETQGGPVIKGERLFSL